MPDSDSVKFWQQVAGVYSSSSNVLFALFNEPHPQGTLSALAWACWQQGCQATNDTAFKTTYSYQSVGMQALVNAVRNAGSNNIVLVAGINWGYDLSQLGTYHI